jgi:hypothetical protein
MSHSPGRRKIDKLEREEAAKAAGERAEANARASARAVRVVTAWNKHIADGRPADYFPTIGAGIASGHYFLKYRCPACRQDSSFDLRDVTDQHHRRAPISVLIPSLSCQRCCPNPPFATLLALDTGTQYTGFRLADVREAWVEIACHACERRGRLATTKLIATYGTTTVMPDLLRRLAKKSGCERVGKWDTPCGAYYVKPLSS